MNSCREVSLQLWARRIRTIETRGEILIVRWKVMFQWVKFQVYSNNQRKQEQSALYLKLKLKLCKRPRSKKCLQSKCVRKIKFVSSKDRHSVHKHSQLKCHKEKRIKIFKRKHHLLPWLNWECPILPIDIKVNSIVLQMNFSVRLRQKLKLKNKVLRVHRMKPGLRERKNKCI
jgi:hypothetical protein